MTEPTPDLPGRELLAIRARTARAAAGQHQSLRQTETDRARLLGETYRLGNRVKALEANGTELLARAEHAEGELSARRDHETRWETEHRKRTEAEAERDAARLIVEELQALRDSLYGHLDSAQQDGRQ